MICEVGCDATHSHLVRDPGCVLCAHSWEGETVTDPHETPWQTRIRELYANVEELFAHVNLDCSVAFQAKHYNAPEN